MQSCRLIMVAESLAADSVEQNARPRCAINPALFVLHTLYSPLLPLKGGAAYAGHARGPSQTDMYEAQQASFDAAAGASHANPIYRRPGPAHSPADPAAGWPAQPDMHEARQANFEAAAGVPPAKPGYGPTGPCSTPAALAHWYTGVCHPKPLHCSKSCYLSSLHHCWCACGGANLSVCSLSEEYKI